MYIVVEAATPREGDKVVAAGTNFQPNYIDEIYNLFSFFFAKQN